MKKLTIEADSANVSTIHHDNQVHTELTNPHLGFIKELENEDIIMNCDSAEELFKKLLEDEEMQEVLHEHLRASGYIYNKA